MLIPYVEPAELQGRAKTLWEERQASGPVPTSYRSFLNSPGAAVQVSGFGKYLRFDSEADPRARELAVLVVNSVTDCEYGWVHHEYIAQEMGIPQPVIDAIRERREPEGLPEVQHLGWRLADETMRDGRAQEATVLRLVELVGREDTIDLILAVGYYTLLAQYFLTVGLELREESLLGLTGGEDVARAHRFAEQETSTS